MSIAYREFAQVIITAVVYVEIDITVDAGQTSGISVLPKLPFARIFNLVYVIMGNPIRIVVKDRCVKIIHLEFIISIYNWFNMVSVFHDVQPCKYVALKVLNAYILRFVLDVKHGWKVAVN